MSSVRFSIILDSATLERVDRLVAKKVYRDRSRAIQSAVAEKLARMERGRLASECAKLDSRYERAFAEKGLGQALEGWPDR
jgi:metal-responsive CopG/Arc/MetJ family transcriptional regulator